MASEGKLISSVINSDLLETLAHPIRQQILIFIEQEGRAGYKSLKTKFNIATGTLYHHLRVLKGLINQDGNKQYILTEDGKQALDYLFQDNIQAEKEEENTLYSPITLPSWVFYIFLISYASLSLILIAINPSKILIHFIPIEITDPIIILLFFVVPITQIGIIIILSMLVSRNLNKTSWSLLILYQALVVLLSIILNIVDFANDGPVLYAITILLQALFIVLWTYALSIDILSWERSLLLALLQNYVFLLLI